MLFSNDRIIFYGSFDLFQPPDPSSLLSGDEGMKHLQASADSAASIDVSTLKYQSAEKATQEPVVRGSGK